MAITAVNNPSSLRLKFDLGLVDGKAKRKSKSYSNLKHDASDEDVYEVGVALSSLQEHTLIDINKIDTTSISE